MSARSSRGRAPEVETYVDIGQSEGAKLLTGGARPAKIVPW